MLAELVTTPRARRGADSVDNPIAFVRAALRDTLRSEGAYLSETDFDECASYLLEVYAKLITRFDPSKGSMSFESWAYDILQLRYRSWLREHRGDARYGVWFGGDRACRHAPVADAAGRPLKPKRCACGAQWLGNDGREQSAADPDDHRRTLEHVDETDFESLVASLDHEKLSPRSRGALNEIGRLVVEQGLSVSAAARAVGKSSREARADLARLRQELFS